MNLDTEIKNFIASQLESWETAALNHRNLSGCRRKTFEIGGLKGYVQFNPARIASNTAKVDSESIRARRCFLCPENRPGPQKSLEIFPGWEVLVNPFPILPNHLTIANKQHIVQRLSVEAAYDIVGRLPGMTLFYNDDGAGASAPDHCHFQAVETKDLPLIQLIDRNLENFYKSPSESFPLSFEIPFRTVAGIIRSTQQINEIEDFLSGKYRELYGKAPLNAFFWQAPDKSVRFLFVPRKTHRPECFFRELPERRSVSPGAIDMAGIIVTPFEEDFMLLDNKDIEKIYSEVAFG